MEENKGKFADHRFLKKVVFMGTPSLSASILENLLLAQLPISAVFTQEDSVSARGNRKLPTPVKEVAQKWKIPVFQPKSVNRGEGLEILKALHPDMILLIAFGKLLHANVLNLPAYGALNLHPSCLPKYRGAAPIQRCLLNGDSSTAICIMRMIPELDAGPIAAKTPIPILMSDTLDTLQEKIIREGSILLQEFFLHFDPKTVCYTQQDNEAATYAKKIEKEDLYIHWNHNALDIYNQIRSFDSDPLACTQFENSTLKISGAVNYDLSKDTKDKLPGSILDISRNGAKVVCGIGSVLFRFVQFPGKKRIEAFQALQGRLLRPGACFLPIPVARDGAKEC